MQDDDRLPVETFQITQIPPGSTRRLELVIDHLPDGQRLSFPTLIARGAQPGKTLLALGAVHGDEYEGTAAIQDTFSRLDPAAMRGTFVGIPVMNGPAFVAAQREGHWDQLNLARVFPGSASGSPTMRIAHAFREHLLPQADLLLDLHSGGNAYAIKHLAGYQLRDGEVGRIQREAAIAFGADLVWGTGGLPGRTLSAAGEIGIPAIYVEMRGEGRCRPEDLARATQGLRHVLAYLGIVGGSYPTGRPRYVVEMPTPGSGHLQVDHPSPTSGIFVPAVGLWERIHAGQPLGQVRHPDGTVLAEVASARDGRVLFLRTLPRVFAGDALAFVLAVPSDDAERP
ncbi:MAG: succinylglutamate desuccinylase/aspartoacylase family protein [Armatimonadota bacterium]